MRFWDSSALLSLLVDGPRTAAVRSTYAEDETLAVWCLTEVELASALARRGREDLEAGEVDAAWASAGILAEGWRTIISVDLVRARAIRLVRTHTLRAADALQLGAALVGCDDHPETLPFVCLDDRLREAARREGFAVLPS
jgi:predicted nucleic acid-binding protein